MKIQIQQNEQGITFLKINDIEMNKCISGFSLTQKAEEVAELSLNMFVTEGMNIELPDGVVVVAQEEEK